MSSVISHLWPRVVNTVHNSSIPGSVKFISEFSNGMSAII